LARQADFDEAPCAAERARAHDIAFASESRVVVDSAALGWSEAFASITSRRAWSARIAPLEHLGIVYCLRGVNRVARRIEGEAAARVVDFRPRQLALLPSHAPAEFRVSGQADVLVVYLRGAMLRAVADRLFGASTRPLHFEPAMSFRDSLLEQFCLTLAEALYRQRADSGRYIDVIAESAAAHCLTRYGRGSARAASPAAPEAETALRLARAYVDEHLDGDLGLEALAAAAGLTPAGLKRLLAEAEGETPKQWVIRRRIERAREMLAGTDLALSEIALRAGFASQSHLCVMFKREVGRTPRDFRRAD
jgi:AraC family transcriptional regulator